MGGAARRGSSSQEAALSTLAVWNDHLARTGAELLAARWRAAGTAREPLAQEFQPLVVRLAGAAMGERLRQQRVVDFIESFGEVGDCSFTSDGHHGTPNQREASARWADELANAKGKKGHIHPARFVSDSFRAVLPEILAPDA